MIALRSPSRQLPSPALVWAQSADATPEAVRSPYGPRYFESHVATTGYASDFHRGCDLPFSAGDPVHAVVAGPIVRLSHTQYGFETAAQLTPWSQVNSDAVFTQTGTVLHIAGNRVGAKTFAQSTKLVVGTEAIDIAAAGSGISTPYGWEIRFNPATVPAIAGGVVGFGFYDPRLTEYVALEYDGTTLTARGIQAAGTLSVDGTTATASPPWLRLVYTHSTGTIAWQYATDNPITTSTTWTTVATKASVAFTNNGWPAWLPVVYWRSTDTNAAVETCDVDLVGWYGANVSTEAIGRFGNWVQILSPAGKVIQMHMQDLAVKLGDIVEAGQVIGYAGNTGFDARSGPVIGTHNHVEFTSLTGFYYGDTDSTNILAVGLLPRVNVSNNVTLAVSTANDPNGVASTLFKFVISRADEDFDLNEISMTGSLGTGTINFNTRAGLDTDTDLPVNGGIYYVPIGPDMTESSPSYELDVYFNTSTFGTLVSGYAKDCGGTVLVSYP